MFLSSVSPFDRTTASPKHPQSDTGLYIKIYTVNNVITDMNVNVSLATGPLLMPNNRYTPMTNSAIASIMALGILVVSSTVRMITFRHKKK
jgi:hypothetical protein